MDVTHFEVYSADSVEPPHDYMSEAMEADVTHFDVFSADTVGPHDYTNVADAAMKGLGESVSFGRFSMDSVSWVKRSSFNHREFLEEAGSCSTPGSVAQKKAYFEAYYKDIAKKKALERALAESSCVADVQDHEEMENNTNTVHEHKYESATENEHISVSENLENTATIVKTPSSLSTSSEGGSRVHVQPSKMDDVVACVAAENDHLQAVEREEQAVERKAPVENIPDLRRDNGCEVKETLADFTDALLNEHILPNSTFALVNEHGLPTMVETHSNEDKAPDAKEFEILDKFEVPAIHQIQDAKEDPISGVQNKDSTNPIKVKNSVSQKALQTKRSSKGLPFAASTGAKLGSKNVAKVSAKETQSVRSSIKKVNESKSLNIATSVCTSAKETQKSNRSMKGANDSKPLNLSMSVCQPQSAEIALTKVTVPQPANMKRGQSTTLAPTVHRKTQVMAKMEPKSSNPKVSQGVITKKSDESRKLKKPQTESRLAEQSSSAAFLSVQKVPNGKMKASEVQQSVRTFNLNSDARAQKRKEFNSKMEAKLSSKESEKNQAQEKTKEEADEEIRQLRKSITFKATPMPNFYQQTHLPKKDPKKDQRKIPLTRPKSPKLGRKSSTLIVDSHSNAETSHGGNLSSNDGITKKKKGSSNSTHSNNVVSEQVAATLSNEKASSMNIDTMVEGSRDREYSEAINCTMIAKQNSATSENSEREVSEEIPQSSGLLNIELEKFRDVHIEDIARNSSKI